ncbi:MAG TPA: hypothetical protein VM430_06240, partial [Microbacterium sp.]|nr:hypothetical protein [Microbacterium sp.]
MGRPIESALSQVIVDLADAGSEAEGLASADGLGVALLPLFALAGSLTAAIAIGTLIVEWLRKPEADSALLSVDLGPPRSAVCSESSWDSSRPPWARSTRTRSPGARSSSDDARAGGIPSACSRSGDDRDRDSVPPFRSDRLQRR